MALPAIVIPIIAVLAVVGIIALLFSSFFILTFLASSVVIVLSMIVSVLITQPFTGAVIRLRANYLPKAVSLDNVLEDGAGAGAGPQTGSATTRKISAYLLSQRRQTAKIGPVVSGIFAMLARTKKLEGWHGIYKGSIPVALQLLLLAAVIALFFDVDGSPGVTGGAYKSAPTAPGQFGFFGNLFFMCFVALVSLPLNIITYRTIVHPRVLPWHPSTVRDSLSELLSPAERAQPWRLYLIPGLLAATFAHIGWVGLLTRAVRHVLVPNLGGLSPPQPASSGDTDYSGPNSSTKEVNPLALIIFLAWCLLSVVTLSPLEVITIRLSVQRPERQQPLHLAYSGASNGPPRRPASYSHQASVPSVNGPRPSETFSDNAKPTADDKPLPSQPERNGGDDLDAGHPSFAIEDEDESNEADCPQSANATAPSAESAAARQASKIAGQSRETSTIAPGRNFGGTSVPNTAPHHPHASQGILYHSSYVEPNEPVIALRPVEEATSNASGGGGGASVVERYEGLKDCIDKLVVEEGVESLYRGAWITALGALGGSLGA